jgi:hypothetical protein
MSSGLNITNHHTRLICSKDITTLRYPVSGYPGNVLLVGLVLGAFCPTVSGYKKPRGVNPTN